ncbi:hypothetical protein PLESTB_001057200 [Pleodorina starrii]|uniref:Uncharacterized protein n=1 Tax=Pleodorina starrii TaxID=330485 RepID=A0A9W6BQR0_9CHLO|nr:hypothetical protein PLESTB_001057200 [Pleodorina starrii]
MAQHRREAGEAVLPCFCESLGRAGPTEGRVLLSAAGTVAGYHGHLLEESGGGWGGGRWLLLRRFASGRLCVLWVRLGAAGATAPAVRGGGSGVFGAGDGAFRLAVREQLSCEIH